MKTKSSDFVVLSWVVEVTEPAFILYCKDRSMSHGLPLVFFSGESSLPSADIIIAAGSTLGSASSGTSPFYLNLKTSVISLSLELTVLVCEPAFSLSDKDKSIIQGVFYSLTTSASFSAALFANASFGSFRASANFGYPPFTLSLKTISSAAFLSLFTTTLVNEPPLSLS